MSVRHVVLFRLHDGLPPSDARVQAAVAASAGLADTVPGGADWRIGPDLSGRDVAAHFGGVGDFESRETLAAFLAHPDHLAVGSLWAPLASIIVCDVQWPPAGPTSNA